MASRRPPRSPPACPAGRSRRPLLLALALLAIPARAGADDEPLPVRVVVRSPGASFRIDPAVGETECPGDCVLHLKLGTYTFVAPGLAQELKLEGPARIEYHAGSEGWQTAGLVMIAGGLLVAAGSFYVAVKLCSDESSTATSGLTVITHPCEDGPGAPPKRIERDVLVASGSIGFSAMVVGAFAYFLSTPGLTIDMHRPPRPGATRSDWGMSGGPGALGLGAWARF